MSDFPLTSQCFWSGPKLVATWLIPSITLSVFSYQEVKALSVCLSVMECWEGFPSPSVKQGCFWTLWEAGGCFSTSRFGWGSLDLSPELRLCVKELFVGKGCLLLELIRKIPRIFFFFWVRNWQFIKIDMFQGESLVLTKFLWKPGNILSLLGRVPPEICLASCQLSTRAGMLEQFV